MATKNRADVGRRIASLYRLWWDTVRRHPDYRREVVGFLQSLRQETVRRRSNATLTGRVYVRQVSEIEMELAQSAHPPEDFHTTECRDPEPSLLFDSPTTIRLPQQAQRRAQAVLEALDLYRTMRRPVADVNGAFLARPAMDLSECAAFEARWGLRFPVPPRAESVPDRLMCAPITHPVRIVSDQPSELVLDIWRPAGMAVLDHIAGILDHYHGHRHEALPPFWSLGRIDTAVHEQFGGAALARENADEVSEYRTQLAQSAGYPSDVNLQRHLRRIDPGSSLDHAASAEDAAARALLHQPGIPPRQARKGKDRGNVVIQKRSNEWLQITLVRPEAVDFGVIEKMVRPHLMRSPVTIRDDEITHARIFRVQDLTRLGRTAARIAEVMGLEDAEDRGRERVAELKAAYGDLIRRLRLPTVSRGR